jgi:uncharacterized protein (DUF2252 family)
MRTDTEARNAAKTPEPESEVTPSGTRREPTPVEHPTRGERVDRGKNARARVPRERQAEFEPSATRPDPIDLLEEQARTRVPELVPIRYGRMSASPFAYYRGAALMMASDLSTTPTSGLRTQICGDAHLSNFGMFATPERRMVFDINDFDETSEGPWEWDVKRLAASVEIAGRDRGFSPKLRRAAVLDAVRAYRTAMRDFAAMTNLSVWYASLDVDELLPQIQALVAAARAKMFEKAIAKVRSRDSMQAFTKLTIDTGDGARLLSQPPLIVPLVELLDEDRREHLGDIFRTLLRSYRRTLASDRKHLVEQFRLVDAARKVVGVGSVGTRAWILLLLGSDDSDPLLLQAKEAEASVVERFVGKSQYATHGQRVVAGQRLMQASSDIFLGWDTVIGMDDRQRDFYVRQFRDWKGSIEIESLRPQGLAIYARYCGWTLARAHARSGDRIAIATYLGKSPAFDEAIAEFAVRYADQNQRDYDAMLAAIKEGRILATAGL